eukprot:CAMPEP_0115208214 /NCGR_PEP_ID=MMETSP0270-20121206/21114_1 /TAXON_ID=71861 /ORGANISM="Scrippsiella trochoidea, Strain CCMP3099" /LENGTH=389 /DNA_ID=CAMNT_0002621827 /DNA_START=71 /DNA_END=1237 /DNA_ORIENTATION=-
MANGLADELDELKSILSLTLEGAKARAVELRIKRKGIGWGKDGTPELKKDAIVACIIDKTFNLKELELLAKASGIKKDGIGWGVDGTPLKTKKDIASSLLGSRRALLSSTSSPSPGEAPGGEGAEEAAEEGGEDEGEGEEEEEEEEEGEEGGGPCDGVTAKMLEDFTMSDLIDLAKHYGVKRDGVNWGKDGTPRKRKRDIIAALIAKQAEGVVPDDLEVPRAEDGQLLDIDTGNWCNFQVEEGSVVPSEFMPRTEYRAHLEKSLGLTENQDVFHIIASANGGPDHPDNYLGALGSSFNRSLGCSMDFFCCFIAGLEKTQKAVERALEAEELYRRDPDKYARLIDARGRGRPTLYSENPYNRAAGHCLSAEELVEQGRRAWARMRLAAAI